MSAFVDFLIAFRELPSIFFFKTILSASILCLFVVCMYVCLFVFFFLFVCLVQIRKLNFNPLPPIRLSWNFVKMAIQNYEKKTGGCEKMTQSLIIFTHKPHFNRLEISQSYSLRKRQKALFGSLTRIAISIYRGPVIERNRSTMYRSTVYVYGGRVRGNVCEHEQYNISN